MTRSKKLFINTISAAIYSIVSLIAGLILPRAIIMSYGSEVNGLTVSITQFVSYLYYLEAGLAASYIFALYKPLANKEHSVINDVISQARSAYVKISKVFLIGILTLSLLYPLLIQDDINFYFISLLVLAIGISGFLEFYTASKFKVLLQADQKTYIILNISLIGLILNLIASLILIKFDFSIILVKLVPLFYLIIRTFYLSYYVKKNYKYINFNVEKTNEVESKRFDAMLMHVSKSINLTLPIIFITFFGSLKAVSVYAIYNLVFGGLKTIINIFTIGESSFGNVIAEGNKLVLKKTKEEYEVFVYFILTLLYTCTAILIIPFVSVYVKGVSDYEIYIDPLYGLLFVIWGYFQNARLPQETLINAAGLYRKARFTNLSQILLIVILLFLLVPYYQIPGALIAMIISSIFKTVAMIYIVDKEILNKTWWVSLRRLCKGISIILISYFSMNYLYDIKVENLIDWLIISIPITIFFLFVVVIINLVVERKIFISINLRIGKILFNKFK